MRKDIIIRPETKKDYKYIIPLILRSFSEGTQYSDGTDILALVEEIRESENYIPELSFVAELDGRIVGHFMFSHFRLSKTADCNGFCTDIGDIVMLAPVAVHADHLRQGIGTAMLRMGIEKAKAAGYKGITVEGNYVYYNRFGFMTSSEFGILPTSGFPLQEPRCMMVLEAYPGALHGIGGYVVYPYINA
ncbi:GNAT family N-acetyltransferase [Paenibacillus xylaniclasticus]|uniref:GNAT family N-acetyltransferase n=1 Tax=Paenibacillus xylaniclasticus TaxID=588083 RepID=UPI000FD983C6|nr:N-acetyltransferase [Paenibacillus xylaniclasticus]